MLWVGGSPKGVAGGLRPEGAHDAGCMVPKAVEQVPTRMVAQCCKRCTAPTTQLSPWQNTGANTAMMLHSCAFGSCTQSLEQAVLVP